jgi:hypothetical protein
MHKLYSFGFNAFQQTGYTKNGLACTNIPQRHIHIKTLLYASWESTILLNGKTRLFYRKYIVRETN